MLILPTRYFVVASLWVAGLAVVYAQSPTTKELPATRASINGPHGLALDRSGHLFAIESEANKVRRIDLQRGTISTVAGNGKKCCYKDGLIATGVSLRFPQSLAVDSGGNIFVAGFEQVRKIDASTGVTTTVAGNGEASDTVDGSDAVSTGFWWIAGLVVDAQGNLFIADRRQEKIFRVDAKSGTVHRIAGRGRSGFGGDGGPALDASLMLEGSIVIDRDDNLILAQFDCRIREIDHETGIINTIAVTGGPEQNCSDAPGNLPSNFDLHFPSHLVLDSDGNIYFLQGGAVWRRAAGSKAISILAGTGKSGFSGDGNLATQAQLTDPSGLAIDSEGNLFIADFVTNRIRRVDGKTKIITTIAGYGLPHRIDIIL